MTKTLLELAYISAVTHYKAARLAVFSELSAANPDTDFDALHHASSRALDLHVSSLEFAKRVWAKSLTYEKAEESLMAKFSEFPHEVVREALASANVATR